jgi:hypothetical protein
MTSFISGVLGPVLAVGLSAAFAAQTPPPPSPGGSTLPRDELAVPGPAIDRANGAMRPGADPFSMLVTNAAVQADLGLTPEQVRHLEDTGVLFRTQQSELANSAVPSAKAELERHQWLGRGAVARVLTPAQLQRLREIMLQIHGPCLLLEEGDLGRELDITPDQSERLRGECHRLATEIRNSFGSKGPGQATCTVIAANRSVIEEKRAKANAHLVELLTAEQQQALQRLQGQHFESEGPLPAECKR